MSITVCENCQAQISGAYCSHCGAKAGYDGFKEGISSHIPDYPLTIIEALLVILLPHRLAISVEQGKVGIKHGLKIYGATIAAIMACKTYLPMNAARTTALDSEIYTPATMLVILFTFYPVHIFCGGESNLKSSYKPLTILLYYLSAGSLVSLIIALYSQYSQSSLNRSLPIIIIIFSEALAAASLKTYYGNITSGFRIFFAIFACSFFLGPAMLFAIIYIVTAVSLIVRANW